MGRMGVREGDIVNQRSEGKERSFEVTLES